MIPSECQRSRFLDPKENNPESRLVIYLNLLNNAPLIKEHAESYPIQISFKTWYICIVDSEDLDDVLTWMRPIISKEQGIVQIGPYR